MCQYNIYKILLLLLNLYLFQFQNASGLRYLLVTVGNSLYFPGVEYIRQYVERAAKKQGGCSMPVVIDCRYVLGKLIFYRSLKKQLWKKWKVLHVAELLFHVFLGCFFNVYNFSGADFTAAKGICALSSSLSARGQPLVLLSPRSTVAAVFSGAGSSVVVVPTANDLEIRLQGKLVKKPSKE